MEGYCDECKKVVKVRHEEDGRQEESDGRSQYICVECNCEVERLSGL